MILVFTRDVMIVNAIRSLSERHNYQQVHIFINRVEFLACATIFNQAIKIVDVLDRERYKDVIWLAEEMDSRGLIDVYYISRNPVHNPYVRANNFIFYLSQLASLFIKKRSVSRELSLPEHLLEHLVKILPVDFYQFIKQEALVRCGSSIYERIHGRKYYLNMRYKVRKRLNLKSRFEYGFLLSTISSNKNTHQ